MKKQTVIALLLLLLIPIVLMLGGLLSNLINPEIAAGHPNYARNYHLLSLLKSLLFLASGAVAGLLWLLVCFLVIRSKQRSLWWMLLAALGPFGFAVLAMLNDKAPAATDRHARFVRDLNGFARLGYRACVFVVMWLLAYEAMVLNRNLMIMVQSVATGTSTAQIIAVQNASSGMWAFAELNEVMFLVALFYLLWPFVFNIVARTAATTPSPKPR
jgi:hypothetical protein